LVIVFLEINTSANLLVVLNSIEIIASAPAINLTLAEGYNDVVGLIVQCRLVIAGPALSASSLFILIGYDGFATGTFNGFFATAVRNITWTMSAPIQVYQINILTYWNSIICTNIQLQYL
jgi:hypothetical protein